MTSGTTQRRASASEQRYDGSILLFGMPRSGTTWLGKLFDSHPDTLYRHEPDSWQRLDMPRYPALVNSAEYRAQIQSFTAGLPQINALRVAGKLPLFDKSYVSSPRAWMMNAGVGLARVAGRVIPEFPVLMHESGDGCAQRRVVWKSIESLGRMGVMLDALPGAVGIQILRHPCGVIASLFRGTRARQFSSTASGSEDYGIFKAAIGTPLGDRYGLTLEKLQALSSIERLAWRWVLANEKALLECSDNPRWLCVRYEDICSEPLAGAQRMFEFSGLDMTDQTRAFVGASTQRTRDGYYSVFKNPERAAERWREELDEERIERIMAIVRRSRIGTYYSDISGADGDAS